MFIKAELQGKLSDFVPDHMIKKKCEPDNTLPQCEKHTTFDDAAASADVRAAFVRNPLDRFLAGVHEHGDWPLCDGSVCDDMISDARETARRLVQEFPHKWRSCEHPSQTYFLSATDLNGKAQSWDLVVKSFRMVWTSCANCLAYP
jgi:hypothetical protein